MVTEEVAMWWLLGSLAAASIFAITSTLFYDTGLDVPPIWVDIGFWSIIAAGVISRVAKPLLSRRSRTVLESMSQPHDLGPSSRHQG